MTLWEYLVYDHKALSDDNTLSNKQDEDLVRRSHHYNMLERLESLGRNGWELVTVVPEPTQTLYYFKKPKSSE